MIGRLAGGMTAILAALAPGGAPQAQSPPRAVHGPVPVVIENFEVGANVYVRALASDPGRNSLWVGTSVGALEIDMASKDVKNTFTRKDGLANEYVFAVAVGGDGAVWFGTNAGGASALRDGRWSTYFPLHGLADYWVYAFAFDRTSGVWIGTWDGVNRFDPATGKFETFREQLINIWVYGIAVDRRGRVWFGTEGGVSMLEGTAWRSWTHEDGLGAPNALGLPSSENTGLGTRMRHDLNVLAGSRETYNPNYVFAALADSRDESVWFGTWGGGASRRGGDGRWTSFSERDGLAGNIVYSIAQEPDGTLWFGTNRGISRYDGKSWVSYTIRLGLIGDHIYAIAIGADGSIWAGSRGGVSRLTYRR